MAKSAYFGKENITPDFLRAAEKSAEKYTYNPIEVEKETAREASQEKEETTPNNFSYTGRGKSLAENFKKSRKLGRGARIKKGLPLFFIGGLAVVAIFIMFTMVGSLGNQIETLITRATDSMFGKYPSCYRGTSRRKTWRIPRILPRSSPTKWHWRFWL